MSKPPRLYYRHTVCGKNLWRRGSGERGRVETMRFHCRTCARTVLGSSGEVQQYNMPQGGVVLLNLNRRDAEDLHYFLSHHGRDYCGAWQRILAKLEKQGVK